VGLAPSTLWQHIPVYTANGDEGALEMKVSPRENQPVVVIIDDDFEIRETLEDLIHSVGLQAETFSSVQEFLDGSRREQPGCLVLDVRLPGRSGLDFHDDLIKANVHLPVVFISGHADVPMSVRAMKAGAVEFLTKPVHHQDLLDAIQLAIKQGRDRRDDERNIAEIRARFETLTQREREAMLLVATGRPNKQVAADMGISMTTVKLYRGQVMQKMQARSLAELVRMADNLNVPGPKV
jgi:FixJ family two-component response regulator